MHNAYTYVRNINEHFQKNERKTMNVSDNAHVIAVKKAQSMCVTIIVVIFVCFNKFLCLFISSLYLTIAL